MAIARGSLLLAASLFSGVAAAQAFPAKPITFVSPLFLDRHGRKGH